MMALPGEMNIGYAVSKEFHNSGFASQAFDVSKETICEIEAPFYSQYDRLLIRHEDYRREYKFPLLASHNGWICIMFPRPVRFDLTVFIAAGPDFRYSTPNGFPSLSTARYPN